jgi:hypothetical protein
MRQACRQIYNIFVFFCIGGLNLNGATDDGETFHRANKYLVEEINIYAKFFYFNLVVG